MARPPFAIGVFREVFTAKTRPLWPLTRLGKIVPISATIHRQCAVCCRNVHMLFKRFVFLKYPAVSRRRVSKGCSKCCLFQAGRLFSGVPGLWSLYCFAFAKAQTIRAGLRPAMIRLQTPTDQAEHPAPRASLNLIVNAHWFPRGATTALRRSRGLHLFYHPNAGYLTRSEPASQYPQIAGALTC